MASGFISDEELRSEQARKEALRAEGIAKAGKIGMAATQAADDLEARRAAAQEAAKLGRRDIQAQQAEALAAGTAAGAGGGSSYGALMQAGKNAGLLGAKYGSDVAQADYAMTKDIGDARQAAEAQGMEALKLKSEASSATADRQKKIADYRSQAEAAMASTKSFFNDDEELAAKKIRALVANEEDPIVRQELEKLANQVEAGDYDY